ncbi:MAG TPA: hypothetical protein VJP88_04505 [Caulobacteraceae bacterium]|nr:hypothetical protein [Caulobacteraceae bacterium]
MTNLTESVSFDAGIYELQTTDPVQGGAGGVANSQAQSLANRTQYLKSQTDNLNSEVSAIQTQLAAPLTTQPAGDMTTAAATDAFVHRAQGGIATVDISAGGNINLTSDEWGCAILIFTGALAADAAVIFPTHGDLWLAVNLTTGAHAVSYKTAAGSSVQATQGLSKFIYCDATNILNASTELANRPVTLHAAATLAVGAEYTVDFSAGVFGVTLPAAPQDGDRVGPVRGNFATSSLTVSRNGNLIADQNGVAQASDYQINRNNASDVFTYVVPSSGSSYWLVTQG